MSEIKINLDDLLINASVGVDESQRTLEDFEFDAFDEIMNRPALESYASASSFGRASFPTKSKTIGINLGEFVNIIAPRSVTVPEYQRDLREVKDEEAPEFHNNIMVHGQTNIVPIIVTPIDRILESLKREHKNIPVGTDSNTEELLAQRIKDYEEFLGDSDDPKTLFNLDGQTRTYVWMQYYHWKNSVKPILYDLENSSKIWEVKDSEGDFVEFSLHQKAFSELTLTQQRTIYENTPISLMIVESDSYKVPATTFSIANSGVPQFPTLTDMNCSVALGLRNQVEKLNLRRRECPEYSQFIADGFVNLHERYNAQNGTMFSKIARGMDAHEMLRAAYLGGDKMNCSNAARLKGVVMFDQKHGKGWSSFLPTLANPVAEWEESLWRLMVDTKTARSLAIRILEQKNRKLKYSTSTKVNTVYFEDSVLDRDVELTRLSHYAYQDWFEWDREQREDSQYLKWKAEDVKKRTDKTEEDIGTIIIAENGKKLKNTEGYYHWGSTQDSATNIKARIKMIDQFVDDNILEWLEKGYFKTKG